MSKDLSVCPINKEIIWQRQTYHPSTSPKLKDEVLILTTCNLKFTQIPPPTEAKQQSYSCLANRLRRRQHSSYWSWAGVLGSVLTHASWPHICTCHILQTSIDPANHGDVFSFLGFRFMIFVTTFYLKIKNRRDSVFSQRFKNYLHKLTHHQNFSSDFPTNHLALLTEPSLLEVTSYPASTTYSTPESSPPRDGEEAASIARMHRTAHIMQRHREFEHRSSYFFYTLYDA